MNADLCSRVYNRQSALLEVNTEPYLDSGRKLKRSAGSIYETNSRGFQVKSDVASLSKQRDDY